MDSASQERSDRRERDRPGVVVVGTASWARSAALEHRVGAETYQTARTAARIADHRNRHRGSASYRPGMRIGLIGAGNLAGALARGWGEPVLCTDGGSGRARRLVGELGGEALSTNRELADRVDAVVLCHKPSSLDTVAGELSGWGGTVISTLGGVSLEALRVAYPSAELIRAVPNTPVAVRAGVIGWTADPGLAPDRDRTLRERFDRLGRVVVLPEALLDVATGLSGVGPAYLAVVAEAMVDAGVRHGLPSPLASEIVAATLTGTGALLAAREGDTLAVRREVTSPGGITARGLAALEHAGLRAAFLAAADAIATTR